MTPQFLRDTGLNFGRWVRVPGGVDVPRSDRVSRCALEWECAWEALSPVEAPVDGRAAFTATSADAVGSAAPLTWMTMETRVQGLRDRGANPERDPVGLIVLFIQAPGRPPRAVALMLATDFASAPAARALCTQHGFVEVGGVSPPPLCVWSPPRVAPDSFGHAPRSSSCSNPSPKWCATRWTRTSSLGSTTAGDGSAGR